MTPQPGVASEMYAERTTTSRLAGRSEALTEEVAS